MIGIRSLDSELYLPACDHARFSWAGREYEGRLQLDEGWALGLLELELTPETYGRELYEAVFPSGSALREGLREALAEVERTSGRLRFRLHLSPGLPDWIHALYWELLADGGGRLSFARSPDTAFSRYSTVRSSLGRPAPGRVRILCAVAAPLDAERFRLAEIDRDAVLDRLIAVLGGSHRAYEMEILEAPVTLERLRERLVEGGFHLLHLVGHGLLESRGVSALVLENEEGKARFVGEELLAELLLGMRELRLVTLMACHGGAPSSSDAFSGLAGRLVERGVPAVLAMRRRIRFDDAELFTLHLYRHLARDGRIDEAVNEARQQLYLKEPRGITWSSPVLYSRLADGCLWQPEAAPPPVVTVVSSFPRRLGAAHLLWPIASLLILLLGLYWATAARWPSVVNKLQIGSPVVQTFVRPSEPGGVRERLAIEPLIYTPSLLDGRWDRWLRYLESPLTSASPSPGEQLADSGKPLASPPGKRLPAPGVMPDSSDQLEEGLRRTEEPLVVTKPGRGIDHQGEAGTRSWGEPRGNVPAERAEESSFSPSIAPEPGGEIGVYKLGLVTIPPSSAITDGPDEAQAWASRNEAALWVATEAFASSGRFTVVERKELAAVFTEKDLKDLLGKGDNRLSDLLGLDFLGVVEYSVTTEKKPQRSAGKAWDLLDPKANRSEEIKVTIWTITVRLVEARTGQIAKVVSSESPSGLAPVPTLEAAGELLHYAVRKAYPPLGVVVKVEGSDAVIDLGQSSGLQKNDVFDILEEGEQLFHPVSGKPLDSYLVVIGQLKITATGRNTAAAKITASQPGKKIKSGCLVRYKSGSGEHSKGSPSSSRSSFLGSTTTSSSVDKTAPSDFAASPIANPPAFLVWKAGHQEQDEIPPQAAVLDRKPQSLQERSPMPLSAGVGLLVASTLLAGSGKAPDYCDEELLRGSARSPQAYKFRDNRCEGEYAQHVSATGLNLRSLTFDLGSFDPSKGLDLTFRVPTGVGADDVRILALSLRPRLYFRMDTEVPVKNDSFFWPGDLLESFDLSSKEIGLRAWVTLAGSGGTVREVYLPVGRKGGASSSKDGYQLCLWPNASLKEVRLSVAQIDAEGRVTKWLRQNEDADLGEFIPSEEPACLSTGPLGPPGYYRVKLSATARKGDAAVEEFDLYHP